MTITITEALAEVKTANKRIIKKREFIIQYLARLEGVKDPLDADGGSYEVIRRERQSILDLEYRIVDIRRGISRANEKTEIGINGMVKTISDWLIWRREISDGQGQFLQSLRGVINRVRNEARSKGASVLSSQVVTAEQKPTDYVINVNEVELASDIELLEDTLGQLDGQLSLKNATIMID